MEYTYPLALRIAVPILMGCALTIVLRAEDTTAGKGGGARIAPRVDRWEQTIQNFEDLESEERAPRGAVLLVGGSNARRWSDVDDYFPERRVINRGFGGARLSEILHFADRLILPCEPSVVLVNAGGNDLNAGSSPEQIRSRLPDTIVHFIGLPYVRRAFGNPESRAAITGMNQQLAQLAESEANVGFIDLAPGFLDDAGAFRPELFMKDGTHFSPDGYSVVAGQIRAKLASQIKRSN